MRGLNTTAAYEAAGFVKDDGNATRLRNQPAVQERVLELQEAAAKENKITIESICAELDAATAVAASRGQASAMVSASALRAKISGLMVDKVEVGAPGAFDKCDTVEAVVDELLRYDLDQFHPATDADRKALSRYTDATSPRSKSSSPASKPAPSSVCALISLPSATASDGTEARLSSKT